MSARMIKLRSTVVSMSLIVIIAMVAVGCGNNTANDNNINKSKTEAASQVKESTPVAEVGTPATEEATTRIVTDAYGETTIPVYPERIVVLNTAALDNLLALGVKPVGAPYSISVNANFFKHLASQTEGIENTGTVDQPNLETIAKLAPDLIIGQKADHEALYEDLKRIAPVYMTEENVDKWKIAFQGHADAVNKTVEGEKLLAEYASRIDKFKADMGDQLNAKTVTLIRPRADHVRIYLSASYPGSIVDDSGIPRPAAHVGKTEHHVPVTEEQIADMDSDVIISFGRENEADFFRDKIQKNPIWKTLSAVKNDEVHMVEWEVWLSGQGIQAANIILDDLTRIFVK